MEPITLGKYQLLKLLAKGGMAEIFAARITGLSGFEKVVAVKRMLPKLADDEESVTMFLDEARIAATLHHPNIVQVYDIGSVDGQYFMSMEYLHGQDVRSLTKALWAKQEALPLEHALHIVLGLTAGLHSAHEKVGFDGKPLGVVHRDVTPQNVFVTYDGSVKIVDFGIAKASSANTKTQHGTIKGKVAYMSPEQCRSERLDRRSDIYAIGIILYELTTGRRLYKGPNKVETMKEIVEAPIKAPSALVPGYPRDLERIVMTALAKNKADRYPTAQAMQVDLETFVRARRLAVSAVSIAQFMHELFHPTVEAWQPEAIGSLPELVTEVSDRSAGSSAPRPESAPREDTEVEVVWEASQATATATGEIAPVLTGRSVPWKLPVGLGLAAALLCVKFLMVSTPVARAPAPTVAPVEVAAKRAPAAPAASVQGAAATRGIVKVTSTPTGANVFVDETPWPSRTPTVVEELAEGPHTVRVERRGFEAAEQPVVVSVDALADVTFTMKRKARHRAESRSAEPPAVAEAKGPPPVSTPTGELRVGAEISCEVLIDGETFGFTPVRLELTPGQHSLRCVNDRFSVDSSRSVDVRSGQVIKEKF